jgi:hypothetical protein
MTIQVADDSDFGETTKLRWGFSKINMMEEIR